MDVSIPVTAIEISKVILLLRSNTTAVDIVRRMAFELDQLRPKCSHDGGYFVAEDSQGTFCTDCGARLE